MAEIRRALLGWYRVNHRKLPWRAPPARDGEGQRASGECSEPAPTGVCSGVARSPSPYAVLVSEAMLQQTQVATVIPYFLRFMETFPTVADLAAADEQRVLRMWQGLGYYRRARNLHAAAKAVVDRFDGRVPGTVEELLTLPGVGRYTAGAVASIAFGVPAPIVDGNVARVWARVFGITEPVDGPAGRTRLWDLATRLVPNPVRGEGHPGDFNQAVMELGATVCTPRSPKCLYCPLAERCEANRTGMQESLPVSLPSKARRAVTHAVVAVRHGEKLLFEQRPPEGLWSNMWQMPTLELDGARVSLPAVRDWLRERLGTADAKPRPVGEFAHATTHRDIAFRVFEVEVDAAPEGTWRRPDDIDDLPLSKPQLTALKLVRASAKDSPSRRTTGRSGGGKRPRASAGRR